MSHFPLIVCLPSMAPEKVPQALEDALAPYDENKEIEPYRVYLENAKKEWEDVVRTFTESPKEKPPLLDELNISAVLSWRHGEEVIEEFPEDSEVALYYRMSTYNPRSKWDWWTIGGRWSQHFHVQDGHDCADLIRGERNGRTPPRTHADRGRADGGRRRALDFEATRTAASAAAGELFDEWTAIVDGLPEAQPWAYFRDRVDAAAYTIDQARRDYGEQPRVVAARKSEKFRWSSDIVGRFAPGREAFVQEAVEEAVPGFALLDLDGKWSEPGQMGWFGLSTDTEETRTAYRKQANAYLDQLPDDAWIVVVDCHI